MRLLLHADDLGLSPEVDDAILEALDQGWCSSASVLANGPSFVQAVAGLRRLSGLDLGLHCNLSEFAPLTSSPALHSLFPEGQMGPAAMRAGPAQAEAILAEWRAQLHRLQQAGLTITHLDSHQHLHHQPVFLDALARLAREAGISRVRGLAGWRTGVGRLRGALQAGRARRFRAALSDRGLRSTDGFASVGVFQARSAEIAQEIGPGSLELMCHPGNPAHPVYLRECQWLAARGWRELPFPVEIVSWRDL